MKQYHDEGYYTSVPALGTTDVARLRHDLEAFEGSLGGKISGNMQFKPHMHQNWAYEVASNKTVLDAIEDCIGPDILLLHFTIWIKDAHTDAFVAWHQDGTYFGLDPAEHITAWVALSDSNELSGCVEVLPGSHKAGVLDHSVGDNPFNMLPTGQYIPVDEANSEIVLMDVPAGHFSLHHTYLLHNSRANRADDRRIGLGISYIPTRVRCSSKTRLTAMLMRGEDRYNHFDHEEHPTALRDMAARLDAHADAMKRWQASRAEQVAMHEGREKAG